MKFTTGQIYYKTWQCTYCGKWFSVCQYHANVWIQAGVCESHKVNCSNCTNGTVYHYCEHENIDCSEVVILGTGWKVVRETSCAQPGLRQRTCKTCGYVESEEIPALYHQYSCPGSVSTATCPTCNGTAQVTCGTTLNDWESHTKRTITCFNCGTSVKASIIKWVYERECPSCGKSYDLCTNCVDSFTTCTNLVTCSNCTNGLVPALCEHGNIHCTELVTTENNHSEKGWITINQTSCITEKMRVCVNCGKIETMEEEHHNYVSGVCSICGKTQP